MLKILQDMKVENDKKDEEIKWLMRQNQLRREDLEMATKVDRFLKDVERRDQLLKDKDAKETEKASLAQKLASLRDNIDVSRISAGTSIFKSVDQL